MVIVFVIQIIENKTGLKTAGHSNNVIEKQARKDWETLRWFIISGLKFDNHSVMLFKRLCQVPHCTFQTQRTNAIFVLWKLISYFKHQRMTDEAIICFVNRSCVHVFYCVYYGSLWKKKTRKKYAKTINTPGMLFPFGLFHCLNEEKEERILSNSMN